MIVRLLRPLRLHRPSTLVNPNLRGRLLYTLGHFLFWCAFRSVWRMRVEGLENLPRDGGLLLAPNHTSFWDPPIVGCCVPRPINFMAKQELFEVPVLGWLIRQVNAFPIRRVERDVSAFRTAQRVLLSGGTLIVFPEGTRQRSGQLGKPKPGAAMLSIKSGVPVVPVYVHDSNRMGSLARLVVCFGRPIPSAGETDYAAFTQKIMDAIAQLKENYIGSAS